MIYPSILHDISQISKVVIFENTFLKTNMPCYFDPLLKFVVFFSYLLSKKHCRNDGLLMVWFSHASLSEYSILLILILVFLCGIWLYYHSDCIIAVAQW